MILERGELWAALRDTLPKLRNEIKQVAESDKYEEESILFDSIARRLADAVAARFAKDERPCG